MTLLPKIRKTLGIGRRSDPRPSIIFGADGAISVRHCPSKVFDATFPDMEWNIVEFFGFPPGTLLLDANRCFIGATTGEMDFTLSYGRKVEEATEPKPRPYRSIDDDWEAA